MFCVFSGQGVLGLRRYLNSEQDFAETRDSTPGDARHRAGHAGFPPGPNAVPVPHPHNQGGAAFDDAEPDVVDDDDGLEDGSEMAIDTQPILAPHPGLGIEGQVSAAPPVPPPPPQLSFQSSPNYQHVGGSQFSSRHDQLGFASAVPPRVLGPDEEDGDDAMYTTPIVPSTSGASTAALGPYGYRPHQSLRTRQTSGARSVHVDAGPSTASVPGPTPGRVASPGLLDAPLYEGSGPIQHHGNNSGSTS